MSDQDLVAVIYPVIYKDRPALSVEPILAHPRCIVPGSWKQQQTQPSQSYPLKSNDDTCPKEQAPINLPYIPLRFSCGPRTSLGFVFGTDPKSDIHLGNTNGISNYHFALTYKNTFNDGYYRLVVRDLGSSGGTMVIYRGTKTNKAKAPRAGRYNKGKEKRRNFDWILHGFPHPDTASYVSVKVAIDFELLIMVVKHDLRSPAYIDNVRRFRQGQIDPETLFGVLDIQSLRPTGLHTLSDTPGSQPMLLYEQKLSEGTFGAVTQAWDVSTGISYALKEPIGDCYNKQDWKEEIDMMASLSHEHIVKIFLAGTEPTPYMYIELMPLGNLENVHETASLSRQECVVILHQGMSALAYLHAECIAHRDIKPQNILVRHRGQNSLHIKLTDFGLSKAGSLRSIVGTWTYLAPEIATGAEEYYTQAVDIWSLGVVILRFTHGLPPPGYGRGWIWCQKIADHAARCGIENPMSLLRRMLVIEPSSRPSAEACLHETSQLLMAFEERRITPLSRVGMVTNKPSGGLELQGQARVQRWHPQNNQAQCALGGSMDDYGQERIKHAVLPSDAGANRHRTDPPHLEPVAPLSNTPAIQHTPDGLIYVFMRGYKVSMRASDRFINISEVMTAAMLSRGDRAKVLRKLKKRTVISNQKGRIWAPFKYGVQICRELNLERELRGLLSHGPLPLPGDERDPTRRDQVPEGYHILELNKIGVAYEASMRIINAAQVLKSGGMPSSKLGEFFLENHDAWRTIKRGPASVRGTYIKMKDLQYFCSFSGASQDLANQLLRAVAGFGSGPRETARRSEVTTIKGYPDQTADDGGGEGNKEADAGYTNNNNHARATDDTSSVDTNGSVDTKSDATLLPPRNYDGGNGNQEEDQDQASNDHGEEGNDEGDPDHAINDTQTRIVNNAAFFGASSSVDSDSESNATLLLPGIIVESQPAVEDVPGFKADHYSAYTERSYADGSYLAPPNLSHEELRRWALNRR